MYSMSGSLSLFSLGSQRQGITRSDKTKCVWMRNDASKNNGEEWLAKIHIKQNLHHGMYTTECKHSTHIKERERESLYKKNCKEQKKLLLSMGAITLQSHSSYVLNK